MELKTTPKSASQFWPNFIKNVMAIVILSQIVISLALATGLVLWGIFSLDSVTLWIISGSLLIINLSISLLIIRLAVQPTKDLLAAIIHVSNEQPALHMPNINDEKYAKTGLRDALQTIYELSSERDNQGDGQATRLITDTTKSINSILNEALNSTSCGLVVMDSYRKIVYSNKSAPIHIDNSGVSSLHLLFNGNDTIDAWLDDCMENSVHAEHAWVRIPDRLPNEENRRFFDIIASYEKGAAAETVLALIDRTSSYTVDEENLDFIAFAAHELRGPITVVRGYLDVLQDELDSVLQDDQRELFRRLVVSSNRLSGYVDNILNTSRYDRRHLKMHLAEDSITSIYDTISDDMTLRAGAQNRLLSVEFPSDLPTIAADRASIGEVICNLIDNAIKYSSEGGVINITAKINGDFVDVSVQDHGIGMPPSVVSNLFQKFYRSYRSRETVTGTGIGLYISKAIVESHGGTISVRSEEGQGSTFTISLPIFTTVADKLQAGDNSNEGIISEGNGWIKNHSMIRG